MSYFPPVPSDRRGDAMTDPFAITPGAFSASPSALSLQQPSSHARHASHHQLNYASPMSGRFYSGDVARRGRSNTFGWTSPKQNASAMPAPSVPQMQILQRSRPEPMVLDQFDTYDHGGTNALYRSHLARQPSQSTVVGLERQATAMDPTYETPERRQQHHRYDSRSSQYFPDDLSFSLSEPSSDYTSDMSDSYGWPSMPAYLQPYAPRPPSALRFDGKSTAADPREMPEFLMDELKMLKLENMALRQLAHEVVSVEHGKEANAEAGTGNCAHHPPLQQSAILQHVCRASGSQTSPSAAAVDFVLQNSPQSFVPAKSQLMHADRTLQQPYYPTTQTVGDSGKRKVRTGSYDEASAGFAAPLQPLIYSQEYTSMDAPAHNGSRPSSTASTRPFRAYSEPSSVAMASAQDHLPIAMRRLDAFPASMLVNMILEKRGQEASMLLQGQAQSASQERKDEIYEAVRRQLLPLCYDRHGNFLVQRMLETRPEIVQGLSGAYVELATSQFSCHVVQKVLEGDQEVRRRVTEELLLSRLDQTMTSRNSIHVWQQILETDWTDADFRKRMFSTINAQLKGKWADVAIQETGSIICQNIFESAKDKADKQECMQEVLARLEECASNQWGIWVVQHIIEHGDDKERASALDGLLKSAITLTLSPYGQKAIMSALKTTSNGSASEITTSSERSFVERYVNLICQPSGDQGGTKRPALVDISLAPQGIQIITQLLTTVKQELRDKLITAVRRNSVFLKGSKTGMKVHQLCERARAFAGY